MRISIVLFLLLSCNLYADRVCLEITGKLIEYQSGDAPLGTLKQNAINSGYKENEVIEKYVTKEEWRKMEYEQITKPVLDKRRKEKEEIEKKKTEIINKLNITENDFEILKQLVK